MSCLWFGVGFGYDVFDVCIFRLRFGYCRCDVFDFGFECACGFLDVLHFGLGLDVVDFLDFCELGLGFGCGFRDFSDFGLGCGCDSCDYWDLGLVSVEIFEMSEVWVWF